MASFGLETVGMLFILATIYLLWAARPSTNGPVRRFAVYPGMAPMYPILLMVLFTAGVGLMSAGFGAQIGLQAAAPG
jgi:hypothetical protein